jgi:hypothetical protein
VCVAKGYFIVVNDIHGNPRYTRRGIIRSWKDCISKINETTSNSELPLVPFLHECDAPIDIIYSMFEFIKLNLKVDFLIWLGYVDKDTDYFIYIHIWQVLKILEPFLFLKTQL